MAKKHAFIRGTIVLTITGLSTRFMGFFYRIFLSHAFGEENVGLYQLIFPVYTLFISLSSAGFQTSISRTVARKMSLGRPKEAKNVLLSGLIFSCSLAFAGLLFIQANSAYIAEVFLGDPRCRLLLTASSYALPCSAVHSCICGYCYGLKQTKIPALSQLIEQTVRIASVALLYIYLQSQGTIPSVLIAVSGLVAGEFAAALYSAKSLWGRHWRLPRFAFDKAADNTKELLLLSLPLTANRLFVTLLQSIEAAAIPNCLKLYTHSASQSLRIYGVLTGMALPCILFPSALTNSVSIMLMPAVAENQAAGHDKKLSELIKSSRLLFYTRTRLLSLLSTIRFLYRFFYLSQFCCWEIYRHPRLDLPFPLCKRSFSKYHKRLRQNNFHSHYQFDRSGRTYRERVCRCPPIWHTRLLMGIACKPVSSNTVRSTYIKME